MKRRVTAVWVAFVFLGGQLVFAQQIDSTEKTGRPPEQAKLLSATIQKAKQP